jgi:hypothetical protein
MAITIQLRRDLASEWTSFNPTLANGELAYETDTLKFKLGNGIDDWNNLDYLFQANSIVNNNFSATTNPSASDDSTQDYSIGSSWVNTTTDQVFVCVDNATGSAIWINITDKYTKNEVDTFLLGKADVNHTHVASDITDFDTEVSNNVDVSANSNHRTTTGNPHDLVYQDIVPISVTPPLLPNNGDKFIRSSDYREFIYDGFKWLSTSTETEGYARNSSNVSNSYLRTYNGTPSNLAEFLVPEDITITGITLTSDNSVIWVGTILESNLNFVASVSTAGTNSANIQNLNVNVNAGTRLRTFLAGTNVRYPKMIIYYRRRAS